MIERSGIILKFGNSIYSVFKINVIQQSGLTVRQLEQFNGRTAVVAGHEYLFFSGYSYLGMNYISDFTGLVKEGIDKYGLSFPSSRISNTRLYLFEEMEQLLSNITGSEETVCFASGYTAGSMAAQMIDEHAVAAPGAHPAIRKVPPTPGNFVSWQQEYVMLARSGKAHTFVADAVNIFEPCVNDFSFLTQCPSPVTALIDDSHGIGITGLNGKGAGSMVPRGHNITLAYSLSKAFNLIGGAVSCNAEMACRLRESPDYTAATSLSPAFIHAFIKGQALYQQQRKRLQQNIRFFREVTEGIPGIKSVTELPIFVLPPKTSEAGMYQGGILISSFAYPDPKGPALRRIIVNALHTEDDLCRLAAALHRAIPANS